MPESPSIYRAHTWWFVGLVALTLTACLPASLAKLAGQTAPEPEFSDTITARVSTTSEAVEPGALGP